MITIKSLRKDKGIIISDAVIAVLLMMVFVGVIMSLMLNVFRESAKIKISSQQMDYITEIFEYVEKLKYEEVTADNLIKFINDKNVDYVKAAASIDDIDDNVSYKMAISVESYIPTDETLPKYDLIKTVTLTIENNLADESYTTTSSKIKKANMDEVAKIIEE